MGRPAALSALSLVALVWATLMLVVPSSMTFALAAPRRTSKEWSATLTDAKLRQMELEEDMLALTPDSDPDKPGIIFISLNPGYETAELKKIAATWQSMLKTAGITASLFDSSPQEWVLTTPNGKDAKAALEYLHEQPLVAKTVWDGKSHIPARKQAKKRDET